MHKCWKKGYKDSSNQMFNSAQNLSFKSLEQEMLWLAKWHFKSSAASLYCSLVTSPQMHFNTTFSVRTHIHKATGCHLQEDAAQRPYISSFIVAMITQGGPN